MAYYNKNTVSPFDAVFDSAAKSTGLRYDFLRNIAQLESGYRADARPPVDKATGKRASSATGVMQLIKGTGAMYGLNTDADFLDPNKNINAGAKYLAQMLKLSKGDEMRAALAYHSGPGSQDIKNYDAGNYGAISKWGQDYLRKVNGTAQGGQHASDYYSSNTPKPEVLGDIHQDTSTTPANSNANAIHQLLDTPDAVPSVSTSENYSIPQADTSRDVEYANQHFGQNQAEYDYNTDSTSTMHGTGAAVENALGNSVVGTFGRAWQTQGFGAAVNT
ncbi:UNVERIFIED_CONTAM: transglycosylase SLT domain-containing protein, partial [Kocuria sp. CPCC 205274]